MSQFNNSNIETILSANNKGVGKTDNLVNKYFLDENTLTIPDVGTANVSIDLIGAKFIQLFNSFVKDLDDDKKKQHLEALNNGFLTLDQLKASNKGTVTTKVSLNPKKVLTASEYYSNCVKLALDVSNFEAIDNFVSASYDDKTTKAVLLEVIHNLQKVFFSEEQRAVHQVIVDKEYETAKQYQALTDLGFTVTVIDGNRVKANIDIAGIKTATSELSGIGYKLVASNVDMNTFTVEVILEKGEAEVLA